VLHAGGDATGAEIERALIVAVRARSPIVLYEETYVSELLTRDGACVGVQAVDRDGQVFTLRSRATVLANGGAGGLWLRTSNPLGATADGLALALRAGAALADLEFMQFHPTVLMVNNASHLISEAVRGEGAYLRNHAGERFMPRYSSQAELAPRDVVARAILSEMRVERTDYQYLDLRHLPADKMHARFPTIAAICRQYGLDLAADLLPVAPAAHYCMGGVLVNTYGQTTLPGLYAVGEVACTGVHGANRLASNSLLEGLVYGVRVADGLVSAHAGSAVSDRQSLQKATTLMSYDGSSSNKSMSGNADDRSIQQVRRRLQQIMWQFVSLVRDEQGLLEARQQVQALGHMLKDGAVSLEQDALDPRRTETTNMLQVAELVIAAALERRESRGSHWRQDYQLTDQGEAGHHYAFQLRRAIRFRRPELRRDPIDRVL